MLTKLLSAISIIIGIGIIILIGWWLISFSAIGGFVNGHSFSDLKENFEENKIEIYELKKKFNEIVPKGYLVRISYDSSDEIDLFVYEPVSNSNKHELLFQKWNINFNDYKEAPQTEYEKKYHGKTNSLEMVKEKLKWTNNTFNVLYKKLEAVNCMGISISNSESTEIEFGYIGMGAFSYLIFDENLDNMQQEEYSNDCTLLFYKDNIVFKYGSGAIGSLCTPEFKRKK